MLATVGDVVDDIVVRVAEPIRSDTDTPASIARRRGGSAANVAAVAAHLAGSSRFLGQVGDDAMGALILGELHADGVDTTFVRRAGRTGSIVVLVDASGERSFLTDPGSARMLDSPDPVWLDGIDVLHVPFYSLVDEPIATTARTLASWARARGVAVSVDASSTAVLESVGAHVALDMLTELAPDALFANADEARVLGIDGAVAGAITFVKRGARPVSVHVPGAAPVDVPADLLDTVSDTTGAGDAFAAGVLTFPGWRDHPVAAAHTGHHTAAQTLLARR